jgi:hypothetical protein
MPGATALPHSPQNFWPLVFSCPHSGQVVIGIALVERPAD